MDLTLPPGWSDCWLAALSARATARADLLLIGDSVGQGFSSSTTTSPSYTNIAWPNGYMGQLETALSLHAGCSIGALWEGVHHSTNFISNLLPADCPWTINDTVHVSATNAGLTIVNRWVGGYTSPLATYITPPCTAADLYAVQISVAGPSDTLTYTVDGGAPQTITNGPQSTDQLIFPLFSGLAKIAHTVVFTTQSTANALNIGGIISYANGKPGTGLGVARAAYAGSALNWWLLSPGYPVPHFHDLGGWGNGGRYGGIGFPTSPHLAIIEQTINDCQAAIAVSDYQTALDGVCAALRTGRQNCSILLVIAPNPSQTFSDMTSSWFGHSDSYNTYISAIYTVAAKYGAAVYNAQSQFGNQVVARGLVPAVNEPHPSQVGHRLMANTILGALGMSSVVSLSAGTISDAIPGTVQRQQGLAGDGLGGVVVNPNPVFAAGLTTGWAPAPGAALTAVADAAFGPNLPYCGQIVCSGAVGRFAAITQAGVGSGSGLACVGLAYLVGGGSASVSVQLYDPTGATLLIQTTVTITGDLTPLVVNWTSAQIAGAGPNPLLLFRSNDTTPQTIRFTNLALQPPGDGSVFVGPAVTNLSTNGGAESSAWATFGAGITSVNRVTSDHFFGTACQQVITHVASFSSGEYVTNNDQVIAGTVYTLSVMVKRNDLGVLSAGNIAADIGASGVSDIILAPSSITLINDAWYRCVWLAHTVATTGPIQLRFVQFGGASTYFFDGEQHEVGAIANPYVETNGSTAARVAGRLTAPATGILTYQQMWVCVVYRFAWGNAALAGATLFPIVFEWGALATRLMIYYFGNNRTFVMDRNSLAQATSAVQTHNAGDTGCTIGYATPSAIGISAQGAAYVTTAYSTLAAISDTAFSIASTGQAAPLQALAGAVFWYATGIGTPPTPSVMNGYGKTPPTRDAVNAANPGCICTSVWSPANGNGAQILDMSKNAGGVWQSAPPALATPVLVPAS